jgi:superfamily II DNA helicase RecQ
LTATATPEVRRDISFELLLKRDAYVALAPFNRPNISYHVKYKVLISDVEGDIIKLVKVSQLFL